MKPYDWALIAFLWIATTPALAIIAGLIIWSVRTR